MAFRFSLEAVLNVRRSQEQSERRKLDVIVSEQSQIRAALQELDDMSRDSYGRFQQRLGGGVTGSELQLETLREANINLARNRLLSRLAECEQRRATQTQIFFQTRRNREVLDDLRLRKFQDYRVEQARREQQELDDLFLMRHEFQDRE